MRSCRAGAPPQSGPQRVGGEAVAMEGCTQLRRERQGEVESEALEGENLPKRFMALDLEESWAALSCVSPGGEMWRAGASTVGWPGESQLNSRLLIGPLPSHSSYPCTFVLAVPREHPGARVGPASHTHPLQPQPASVNWGCTILSRG